jgi:quercetin dioxygenase-like cupin family protein
MIESNKMGEPVFDFAASLNAGGRIMRSRRYVALCGTVVFLLFAFVAFANAADQFSQVFVNYADVLKANPMPAGAKAQMIKVAEDETATINIGRFAPGAEVKSHFHKSHSETIYVVEGNGQMVMDGKTLEVKPGAVIFNTMNKAHAVKNTGSTDIVVIQVFAPAWKEPDRVMVP